MIKSELVQKLAEQNPHLFQRDIEKIVAFWDKPDKKKSPGFMSIG